MSTLKSILGVIQASFRYFPNVNVVVVGAGHGVLVTVASEAATLHRARVAVVLCSQFDGTRTMKVVDFR